MEARDAITGVVGAAFGLGIGLAIGLLPIWDGEPPRVAAPPPTTPSAQADRPARPAIGQTAAAPAAPDAGPSEEAAERKPVVFRNGEAVPCTEACLERLTVAVLTGRVTGADFEDAMSVWEAIARRIADDPSLQRRFLGAVSSLSGQQGGPGDHAMLVMMMLQSDTLPDDVTGRAIALLAASPTPELRSLALGASFGRSGRRDEARAAVENALTRETDPTVLMSALNYFSSFDDDAFGPSLLGAVRQMATGHDDPRVREAALAAYAWRPGADPQAVRGLMERALGDPDPIVRVGAIGFMLDGGPERPSERGMATYRDALNDVANDADADPQARLEALSILTYAMSAEDGRPLRPYD